MSNRFRVALRVGKSYMDSLYCSWPLGVLELLQSELVVQGPFVGCVNIKRNEIVDFESRRSLINKYLRIVYLKDADTRIVDIYSFKIDKMLYSLRRWMNSES